MNLAAAFASTPALLLFGCGGYDVGQAITTEDATVLIAGMSGGSTEVAGTLSGPVDVIGGCVGIDDTVVVWPEETEVVDEDPLTVKAPGHEEFSVGDEIEVEGWLLLEAKARSQGVTIEGVTLPRECAERNVWL